MVHIWLTATRFLTQAVEFLMGWAGLGLGRIKELERDGGVRGL